MRMVYLVPTATLNAHPLDAQHQGTTCPGTPLSLVIVEQWHSHAAQDVWEALPGVLELVPWEVVPPVAIPALEALRTAVPTVLGTPLTGTETVAQALKRVRAAWPAARLND